MENRPNQEFGGRRFRVRSLRRPSGRRLWRRSQQQRQWQRWHVWQQTVLGFSPDLPKPISPNLEKVHSM